MYTLRITTTCKKDLKRVKNKTVDFILVTNMLHLLQDFGAKGIPEKMKPNQLKGKYKDHWECHIKPHVLIIWFQIEEDKTITLVRIGSHSDLFK